jgi:hypothetical protein
METYSNMYIDGSINAFFGKYSTYICRCPTLGLGPGSKLAGRG